jgi:predicted permease
MWQDLRYSVRTLRKQPLFAALAATLLALGIGLNTAVFSVVSALLFRPLPVTAPEELVYIYWTLPRQPERPAVLAHGPFEYLRDHNEVFAGLSGTWGRPFRLTAEGETELMNGEAVQPGYFETLGVGAQLGRLLTDSDSDPAATESAIVISHDLWTRRFNGDPGILGRQVRMAGQSEHHFTVVGIAPPGFAGISDPWTPRHFWVPAAVTDRQLSIEAGRSGLRTAFLGVGRLNAGTDIRQARAVVEAQGQQYFSTYSPERADQYRLLLFPASDIRMPYDPTRAVIPTRLAAALSLVVIMVLLVAVSNIAGILMARGVGRASEIAVRQVLGAGGLRIARQLVTESLLLAAAGGLAGLLLAQWLLALFHAFTPLQYALDAAMDWRVLLFAGGICALCGLLVGLAPALQAVRLNILPALSAAGATTTGHARRRLRHGIVLPQVAVSLVLLLVAGVYVRALLDLELADPGYTAANVVVVNTTLRNLPGERPGAMGAAAEPRAERQRRYYQQLLARVEALPGIDAAVASSLPLHPPPAEAAWTVMPAEDYEDGVAGQPTMRTSVSPGYFQAMGMRVLRGRDFDARDTRATPRVGIISSSLAARLWPGDPIGRTATVVSSWPGSKPEPFEVVGVVNEVQPVLHHTGGSAPLVYFAMGQQWQPETSFVIARGRDPHSATQAVREAVAAADPYAEAFRSRTLPQMIAEILYPRRMAAAVLLASGLIALLLASVGIYGVMSYSVAQRLGEIGVRRALGAESRDIARLVIGEGLRVAAIGSLAGLILGYTAIRITSSRFLALPQLDVLTLVLVPLLLAGVVVLACTVPARRATRVDPMDVLRRV